MNEAETRKKLIDARLASAGWKVNEPSRVVQDFGILLAEPGNAFSGHLFANGALIRNAGPIPVREAKRATACADLGRERALHSTTHLRQSTEPAAVHPMLQRLLDLSRDRGQVQVSP